MRIYADLRWPSMTGIGAVKQAMLKRVPAGVEIADLDVRGRIGSSLSPVAISRALIRHKVRTGVFWSPGFMPPAICRIPAVVTVHDLNHLKFYSRLHAAYYSRILKPLYRRCRAIICVSEFTRNEFLEWSGISPLRVFTAYNGVSDAFREEGRAPGFSFPYVLYPGNRRSYKNVSGLLQAYAISALSRNGIHLVLTGEPDSKLESCAAASGIAQFVHFAGHVNDSDIVGLYRGATLVAFVSLYEGFGLPIVEAMAAGVPVLTSNVAAMPEIAGGAALLVDPYSVESISEGLNRLAFDTQERQTRIRLGRDRVTCFDWDATASKAWSLVTSL